MNPQERMRYFDGQLGVTRKSFPADSDEVRVAKQNYERALKDLLESERTS